VCLAGLLTDGQPPGDGLVRQTNRDQRQNLVLTRGERLFADGCGEPVAEQQRPGCLWRQRDTSRGGVTQCLDDVLGVGVLEQVADCADVKGGHDAGVLAERRQDDDLGRRPDLEHRAGRLDTV